MTKISDPAQQPSELWRWSATELAQGIRTGAISSREATLASLQRIEQVNPHVNALVEVSPEETLEMADAADRAVASGEDLGMQPAHRAARVAGLLLRRRLAWCLADILSG